MAQVNLYETSSDVLQLIHLLETHQEDAILFSRHGIPVAELRLSKSTAAKRQPGIAKGKMHIPEGYFGSMDKEIENSFGNML